MSKAHRRSRDKHGRPIAAGDYVKWTEEEPGTEVGGEVLQVGLVRKVKASGALEVAVMVKSVNPEDRVVLGSDVELVTQEEIAPFAGIPTDAHAVDRRRKAKK